MVEPRLHDIGGERLEVGRLGRGEGGVGEESPVFKRHAAEPVRGVVLIDVLGLDGHARGGRGHPGVAAGVDGALGAGVVAEAVLVVGGEVDEVEVALRGVERTGEVELQTVGIAGAGAGGEPAGAFGARLTGDDVDEAAGLVAAVEDGSGALEHLDLLDVADARDAEGAVGAAGDAVVARFLLTEAAGHDAAVGILGDAADAAVEIGDLDRAEIFDELERDHLHGLGQVDERGVGLGCADGGCVLVGRVHAVGDLEVVEAQGLTRDLADQGGGQVCAGPAAEQKGGGGETRPHRPPALS